MDDTCAFHRRRKWTIPKYASASSTTNSDATTVAEPSCLPLAFNRKGTEFIIKIDDALSKITFDVANDPYEEHDFGAVTVEGTTVFFKIDYYDLDHRYHSPDPADENLTRRVMTQEWEYRHGGRQGHMRLGKSTRNSRRWALRGGRFRQKAWDHQGPGGDADQ
ncbi:MAG: DUF3768 domain-containing protein [Beijerinckiaceae bacterium]|jgi:hypothetical protein